MTVVFVKFELLSLRPYFRKERQKPKTCIHTLLHLRSVYARMCVCVCVWMDGRCVIYTGII